MNLPQLDWQRIDSMTGTEVRAMLDMLQPKMNKYIPHIPTPKQAVFMNLTCREAFFGGAAGGGKSDALLMDALQNVTQRGYSAIIFRKSYADLVKPGALIDRSKEWLLQFPEVRWLEKEKKYEWREKYGPHTETVSILQFGYLETENDKYNYQGGEYQYAGFDELTHMSETNYRYMFSRLRRLEGSSIPLKIRGASNPPDDDQGIWVFDRFVNPKTKNKKVIYIPAGMDDNPYLDKESYAEMLDELDPVTRARLKDGNWQVVRKGNMFKRDWFEAVDSLPPYRRTTRFWDMAASAEGKSKRYKDPDYTVGFKLSEWQGVYYIEDIIRTRQRPKETEALQKITAKMDGFTTSIREEQEPGSSGIAVIDLKARTILSGYNYKGIKSTGSKVQRAAAVSAAAERHQIKYIRGCRNIEAFFDEAESFPGALHDDMVDGLSGAFQELAMAPQYMLPQEVNDGSDSYWGGLETSPTTSSAGYWSGV